MLKLILILAACGFAASDSLAWARWRADSVLAVGLLKEAAHHDSAALRNRIQFDVVWELARRNLQRDTAKAGK